MNQLDVTKALNILRKGGLVSVPTETVYGLAADARNPESLKKIFVAKGRPQDHPLIVHIADASKLSQWAQDISEDAMKLAKQFWPGPLTLILKKAPGISDLITGGQDTIGIRIPRHPMTLKLLEEFGSGIAAPSANRFGRISPTTAQAVREELGDKVDFILDGGPCEVGVESTIIDMTSDDVVILRPGMITKEDIETTLNKPVKLFKKNAPRVSGALESHYAPTTKTRLISSEKISELLNAKKNIGLISFNKFEHENVSCVLMPKDAKKYAHDLYQVLRELDKKNFAEIVIENIPEGSEWDAVRDRLNKAGGGSVFGSDLSS